MATKPMDPELVDCLTKAQGDEPIEAVFFLKAPKGCFLDAKATRAAVKQVVSRAESKASRKVHAVSIFDNLQSFAVRAPASLVREVVNAKEVASGRLNRTSKDLLIRPVSKTRVTLQKR